MGEMADYDIENNLMEDERDCYDEETRKEMDKEFRKRLKLRVKKK